MKDILKNYLKNAGVSEKELAEFDRLYDTEIQKGVQEETSRIHREAMQRSQNLQSDISKIAHDVSIKNNK